MAFPFIGTTAVENYKIQVNESNIQKIIVIWDKCKYLLILSHINGFYRNCHNIGKADIWNYNGTFTN